jgi:hypothetical protein
LCLLVRHLSNDSFYLVDRWPHVGQVGHLVSVSGRDARRSDVQRREVVAQLQLRYGVCVGSRIALENLDDLAEVFVCLAHVSVLQTLLNYALVDLSKERPISSVHG